jgi:hypothetical protein
VAFAGTALERRGPATIFSGSEGEKWRIKQQEVEGWLGSESCEFALSSVGVAIVVLSCWQCSWSRRGDKDGLVVFLGEVERKREAKEAVERRWRLEEVYLDEEATMALTDVCRRAK